MKKLFAAIAILAAAVFCGARAGAQEIITEEPAAARDTALVLKVPDAVDSTLIGLSIKDVIDINQSLATDEGLNMFIFRNQTRVQSGYRVRIFFDNKQSARAASEAAMEAFNKDFQGIPAYRTYQSPFFKSYRANQPFNVNMLRVCPLLDNPGMLSKMVHETGAVSTDYTHPEDVDELEAKTRAAAAAWAEASIPLWEKSARKKLSDQLVAEGKSPTAWVKP